MDSVNLLLDGFGAALTPENLLFALIGVTLGTFVGVLPGIGPAMALALLLPVTYSMDPAGALIMFAGIYYGGMYGGSTTSILLNAPGESSSVMTAVEGNLMAKAGRGAQALATAAIGSFVAGTIATLLLIFTAPVVANFAAGLKSQDYFAITLLAFFAVSTVLGGSPVRGMASLALGLMIGLVGIDKVTGQQRLTFGVDSLATGIDTVVIAVALFAVGEALWIAAHLRHAPPDIIPASKAWMSKSDWKRSWPAWLRGTALGFPFGALSYAAEKKLSRHPEEFGHGAIEGVAGPEAANNASAAGTMVTLLALGIPTTATAAVMLEAFQRYNLQPGPLLFENSGPLVWALLASLLIANLLLLVINLPLAPLWAKLLRLPRPYLYAGILFFSVLGGYSTNANATDITILVVIGLLGFVMRRYGLPVVPAIIGVILGPVCEGRLRTALQASNGDWSTLYGTGFSIGAYVLLAGLIGWTLFKVLRSHDEPAPDAHLPHG
jgi:putative tricarboxylic transport membrane protein